MLSITQKKPQNDNKMIMMFFSPLSNFLSCFAILLLASAKYSFTKKHYFVVALFHGVQSSKETSMLL
jgi:hypothetical protein